MIVNGDIWTDYPFERLAAYAMRPGESAHLVMVNNPPQHPMGDFALDDEAWVRVRAADAMGWTYSGVGIYTEAFFAATPPGKMPLRPLLDTAIAQGLLGAETYGGQWQDVGTPERLQELDRAVSARS
jgi:MurNAc alpha-1-phosphate uridylyltransferase